MADKTAEARSRKLALLGAEYFDQGDDVEFVGNFALDIAQAFRKERNAAYEQAVEICQNHGNTVIAMAIRTLKHGDG